MKELSKRQLFVALAAFVFTGDSICCPALDAFNWLVTPGLSRGTEWPYDADFRQRSYTS
jgi:hypothetical protein